MSSKNLSADNLAQAKAVLLEPFGLDEAVLMRVMGDIFTHQVDYSDMYFQFTKNEGWSLEDGMVKSGSFSIDKGVGVRAVSGDKTAFSYSDEISLTALRDAASAVRSIGRQGAGKAALLPSGVTALDTRSLYLPEDPFQTLSAREKVALLEKVEKLAKTADSRIVQVMAGLAGEYDVVLVLRSDGKIAADIRPLVRLSVTVIAEENGRREIGSSGGGGRFGYGYFSDETVRQYVDQAVHSAITMLRAGPAPAGSMTVVLGSGWPGVLLHEAVGHGLEGDFNRKGSSAFSGLLGQKVAADNITVIDDGTVPNRRGSLNMDDEGNQTQRNVLIEKGVLKGYLQDSLNARLMKMPVTGNGRRQSYAHLPIPRMTNTFMLGGDKEPAEIIASVKNGLYAVNFGGGQVDITSGKFVFSASEAYLIENGKITSPVKGATLIGNGPDVLKRVSMVGNDLKLDAGIGVCGKEGQSVPVGVGMPTIRLDGVTVGGTAG
ncbi:MAG: metalloprotease TldD [Oxalobacter sp.]|nr:metalloprotease TldD [Oxalobacter sp.]